MKQAESRPRKIFGDTAVYSLRVCDALSTAMLFSFMTLLITRVRWCKGWYDFVLLGLISHLSSTKSVKDVIHRSLTCLSATGAMRKMKLNLVSHD